MTKPLLLLAVCCLWELSALTSQAQHRFVSTPGFDPSPVTIASVAKTTPRPVTSMDFLTIRDLRGIQISPDGKSVAYVVSEAIYETNSYRTALFVIDITQGAAPVNLGSVGPPRWDQIGQFRNYVLGWSSDSHYLTCLMKDKGSWQLWRWKREGGQPEQLTHNSYDIQDYEWLADGNKIIFTTAEPLDSDEAKKTLESGILYDGSVRAWGYDTFPRLILEAKPKKTQTWMYDFENRRERKATADEESWYKAARTPPDMGSGNFAHALKLSPDNTMQAFAVSDSESKDSIFIKSVNGGKPLQILQPDSRDINNLWWSNDANEIYFSQLIEDRLGLYAISIQGGKVRQVSNSIDFLDHFSFDRKQSMAACVRYNTTLPPRVAILNLKTGSPQTLFDINPEFQNITLSPATKLELTNKYGARTYGYLIKPPDYIQGKRYPLIVTTYAAGGFLRGAAGNEYPIQVFAANGFVVLDFAAPRRINIRDGDFKKAMTIWYSPMDSLRTALKMLDEMGLVDSNRKGLTGLSYGAEITEFTISHSDLFEAAVTSGPSGRDPFFYYLADKGYQNMIFSEWWGLGHPEGETASRWRELSTALNAERIRAPLMIQAADSELLPTLMLYNSLKELKKPVEMVVYADEGHIKNQPKHRYEVYQRNLDWFQFWLKDKEDPDPAKRAQYNRWRAMRDAVRKE